VDQSGLPSLTQIAENRFRLRLFASKAQEAAFNAIIGAGEYPAVELVARAPQLHESRV